MRTPAGVLLALAACAGGGPDEERDTVTPVCDGILQDDEGGLIDGPFDKDGDGYLDANDADCRANYGQNRLDCDDADELVHPDQGEVLCNGVDDDCNSDTPDARDDDLDGALACDDCDDEDPRRFPGNPEECWDDVDNDCDLVVDPGCGPNYNGTFDVTPPIQYECRVLGIPYVNIAFSQVNVLWNPPYGSMASVGSAQPGALEGTVDEATGAFTFETAIAPMTPAACNEYYRFTGTFTGEDTLTMTFQAQYQGFSCGRCAGLTEWELEGVRVADGTGP